MNRMVAHGKIGFRFDDDELKTVKSLAAKREGSYTLGSRMSSGVPRTSSGVPIMVSGVRRLPSGLARTRTMENDAEIKTFVARFVDVAFVTLRAKLDDVYSKAELNVKPTYGAECIAWMYVLLAELVAALGGGNMYAPTRADPFLDALAEFCNSTLRMIKDVKSGAAPAMRAVVRRFVENEPGMKHAGVKDVFLGRAFAELANRRLATRGSSGLVERFNTYLAVVSSYRVFRQVEKDVPAFMSCAHTVHMLVTLKLLEAGKLRYPRTYADMLIHACDRAASPTGTRPGMSDVEARIADFDQFALDIVENPEPVPDPPVPETPVPELSTGYSLEEVQDLVNSGAVDCPCPETDFPVASEQEPYGRYFDTFCDVFLELYLKHLQARSRPARDSVVDAVAHVLTCCWNVADVRLVPLSARLTDAQEDFMLLVDLGDPPVLTRDRVADETARARYNADVVRAFVDGIVKSVSDLPRLKVTLTDCVKVVRELAKAHVAKSQVSAQHLRFPRRADVFPEKIEGKDGVKASVWKFIYGDVSAACGLTREHAELMMHLAYARKSTHSLAPYFVRREGYRKFLSAQTDAFLERARSEFDATGSPETAFEDAYKLAMNMAHATYVKGGDADKAERRLGDLVGGARPIGWAPAALLAVVAVAAAFMH